MVGRIEDGEDDQEAGGAQHVGDVERRRGGEVTREDGKAFSTEHDERVLTIQLLLLLLGIMRRQGR